MMACTVVIRRSVTVRADPVVFCKQGSHDKTHQSARYESCNDDQRPGGGGDAEPLSGRYRTGAGMPHSPVGEFA